MFYEAKKNCMVLKFKFLFSVKTLLNFSKPYKFFPILRIFMVLKFKFLNFFNWCWFFKLEFKFLNSVEFSSVLKTIQIFYNMPAPNSPHNHIILTLKTFISVTLFHVPSPSMPTTHKQFTTLCRIFHSNKFIRMSVI